MLKRMTALIAGACATLALPLAVSAEETPPGGCTPPAEISGRTIFAENCTLCHGYDGKGGGPLAEAMQLAPPDLTTLAARTKGGFPVDHVFERLRHGGGHKGDGDKTMPVWTKIFAHECGDAYARKAISELEAYLKTIQENEHGGGEAEK